MGGKVVGFKSNEDKNKKLNSHIIKKQVTKKDWFETHVDDDVLQSKLELNVGERFVRIPASEYEKLLSHKPQRHSKFICDRIADHVLSQEMEMTFDNLWEETKTFQQLNNIICKRQSESDCIETIHCSHGMGMNTSIFLVYLAIEMIKKTDDYKFVSKMVLSNNFILKIKSMSDSGQKPKTSDTKSTKVLADELLQQQKDTAKKLIITAKVLADELLQQQKETADKLFDKSNG